MKKVTLKDIANELGVTVGTVSHVLNGVDDISAETRERVLAAAKQLGYVPNNAAASLRSGKTNTIAVIVPDISNPHIARQIKLIEDKMRPCGYSVIILNTGENEEAEREAILTACGKQVDGILLCPAQHGKENVALLERMEMPYLLIGRYFADLPADYVCSDDPKGGYLAGQYLLRGGRQNPLYIGAPAYIEGSRARFDGLCRAYQEAGIPLSPDRFIEIDPRAEGVEQTVADICRRGVAFDAIVAFSDLIAFKITAHLRKEGRNVPVVGFDAVNTHLYMPFSHASVGMVSGGWADKAADALLRKIGGERRAYRELIDVRLYEFG